MAKKKQLNTYFIILAIVAIATIFLLYSLSFPTIDNLEGADDLGGEAIEVGKSNQKVNVVFLDDLSASKYKPPIGMTKAEQDRILLGIINGPQDIWSINDMLKREVPQHLPPQKTPPNYEERIIGGTEVNPACGSSDTSPNYGCKYPFYAYVSQQCGGSLIHPEWVLTAAHCCDNNAYQPGDTVRLGAHYHLSEEAGPHEEVGIIAEIIIYPGWEGDFGSAPDVCLLHLSEPIEHYEPIKLISQESYQSDGTPVSSIGMGLTVPGDMMMTEGGGIGPDCCGGWFQNLGGQSFPCSELPTDCDPDYVVNADGSITQSPQSTSYNYCAEGTIDGSMYQQPPCFNHATDHYFWSTTYDGGCIQYEGNLDLCNIGWTEYLRDVNLEVLDDCGNHGDWWTYTSEAKSWNICVGDNENAGLCHGDSGGPTVMTTSNGEYELIGITSYGNPSCWADQGFGYLPSALTSVWDIKEWISEYVPEIPEDCPLGDLNGDGGFNVLDIVTLANCVLAGNCADLEHGCAGDINGDGGYNVLDIVTLANCVLAGNCGV